MQCTFQSSKCDFCVRGCQQSSSSHLISAASCSSIAQVVLVKCYALICGDWLAEHVRVQVLLLYMDMLEHPLPMVLSAGRCLLQDKSVHGTPVR
jgi:hypothetical protein